MSAVEELTRICAALPAQKVEELVDFALFLQARVADPSARVEESPGDAAWEKIIADPKPRPKLDAYIAAAMAEGPSELLTDEAFEKHLKP